MKKYVVLDSDQYSHLQRKSAVDVEDHKKGLQKLEDKLKSVIENKRKLTPYEVMALYQPLLNHLIKNKTQEDGKEEKEEKEEVGEPKVKEELKREGDSDGEGVNLDQLFKEYMNKSVKEEVFTPNPLSPSYLEDTFPEGGETPPRRPWRPSRAMSTPYSRGDAARGSPLRSVGTNSRKKRSQRAQTGGGVGWLTL